MTVDPRLVQMMDKWIDPVRGKVQEVRLIDVFALGPFMMWYAVKSKDQPDWARLLLAFSGLMTSVYNGVNYVRIKQENQQTGG